MSYPNDVVINKFFTSEISTSGFYTTLDSELRNTILTLPIMITIDTDGEEIRVINGASEILRICEYLVVEQVFDWDNGNWHRNLTFLIESYGFKRTLARRNYTGQFEDVLYTKFKRNRVNFIRVVDRIAYCVKQLKHLLFYHHISSSYFYCSKCKK